MRLDGFFLGLSNGVACLATCAPLLVPYLLGEGKGLFRSCLLTGQFLLGRLLGYLLFAMIAWTIGNKVFQEESLRPWIIGTAYVLFSVLLIFYGFLKKTDSSCPTVWKQKSCQRLIAFWPALLPVAAGFATGLSLCPPLLLALTGAAAATSLPAGMIYFFSFFLGTSALFILVPFIGLFSRFPVLQIIGKTAAGIMGFYYLYSGIILLIQGWKGYE